MELKFTVSFTFEVSDFERNGARLEVQHRECLRKVVVATCNARSSFKMVFVALAGRATATTIFALSK